MGEAGWMKPLCSAKLDPECRANTGLAVFEGELAAVVCLNDTLGKAESEAPASFLRGKSGPEDLLAIGHVDSLARVGNIDVDKILSLRKRDRDLSGTVFNCVESVLDQVLNNPFKELAVELDRDRGFVFEQKLDLLPRLGDASLEILQDFLDDLHQVFILQIGFGADAREPTRDLLEPLKIVVHVMKRFSNLRVRGSGLVLQELDPAHHAGDRCSQLVCSLARHSDPDAALFAPFDIAETDVPDQDPERNNRDLNIGEEPEARNQLRLAVMNVVKDEALGSFASDPRILLIHPRHEVFEVATLLIWRHGRVEDDILDEQRIWLDRLIDGIGEDQWEVDVVDDLLQDKAVVARLRFVAADVVNGLDEYACNMLLVGFEVTNDGMRVPEGPGNDDEGKDQQGDLQLAGLREQIPIVGLHGRIDGRGRYRAIRVWSRRAPTETIHTFVWRSDAIASI